LSDNKLSLPLLATLYVDLLNIFWDSATRPIIVTNQR
jgi:hypothetical protein